MGIISILLLIVFAISALLLILFVLIQDDQGDGLGGMFGGGSSTPFGSRSGNILTRVTSVLGTVFMVSAFLLAWLNVSNPEGDVEGAARRLNSETAGTEWWEQNSDESGSELPAE